MNILLTGGAGFIGSALLERPVGAGHRVAVVDVRNCAVTPLALFQTALASPD